MPIRFSLSLFVCFTSMGLHAQVGHNISDYTYDHSVDSSDLPIRLCLADFGLFEGFSDENVPEGLLVVVRPGSLAEQAGIQSYDVLLELAGHTVTDLETAKQILAGVSPGQPIAFRLRRDSEIYQIFLNRPIYSDIEPYAPTRMYSFMYAHCFGLEVSNYGQSENGGVLIEQVPEHQPGAEAGLQAGDIIVAANDRPTAFWSELYEILNHSRNLPVVFTVMRGNAEIRVLFKYEFCRYPASKIQPNGPAYLGIFQTLNWRPGQVVENGVTIGIISPKGSAERAGLKTGDQLVAIDGKPVNGPADFTRALNDLDKREVIDFLITRNGEQLHLSLVPPRWPATQAAGQEPPAPQAAPVETENTSLKEEETLQPRLFRAFPNPSAGLFTLEFSAAPGPVVLRIFDLKGAMLYTENIDEFNGEYSRQFDFRGLPPGCVLVRVEQQGQVFSKVVVIQ